MAVIRKEKFNIVLAPNGLHMGSCWRMLILETDHSKLEFRQADWIDAFLANSWRWRKHAVRYLSFV